MFQSVEYKNLLQLDVIRLVKGHRSSLGYCLPV